MSDATFETFRQLVGATFRMELGGSRHIAILLSACETTGPGESPARFSLTFKAGPEAPTEQGTYALSADGFGPEPVFLVPVRRLPADPAFPLEYEAVFNRLAG